LEGETYAIGSRLTSPLKEIRGREIPRKERETYRSENLWNNRSMQLETYAKKGSLEGGWGGGGGSLKVKSTKEEFFGRRNL
jgi:hypothetical protein